MPRFLDLPGEVVARFVEEFPSTFRLVSRYHYALHNQLAHARLLREFDHAALDRLLAPRASTNPLAALRRYIRSLDAIRGPARQALASMAGLADPPLDHAPASPQLHSLTYVGDSWMYVYSLLKNRRLFPEYGDYVVDTQPLDFTYRNLYINVQDTYLLQYQQELEMRVVPGEKYNLGVGVVVTSGRGLGTTKFSVSFSCGGVENSFSFYPPLYINELVPKNRFVFLRIGDFTVEGPAACTASVRVVMEEVGLQLKSGFRVYFLDVLRPLVLFNHYGLLFYSVNSNDHTRFIHAFLRDFYGSVDVAMGRRAAYEPVGTGDEVEYGARFFAERVDGQVLTREFRFETVVQGKAFARRWPRVGPSSAPATPGEVEPGRYTWEVNEGFAVYDRLGVKWRIPIVETAV